MIRAQKYFLVINYHQYYLAQKHLLLYVLRDDRIFYQYIYTHVICKDFDELDSSDLH